MAQIMIDTDTESVAGLMTLCRLLTDYANIKVAQNAANQKKVQPSMDALAGQQDNITAHTHHIGPAEQGRATGMLPELGADFTNTETEPDPTKLFGRLGSPPVSNILPFPSPALNLPGATGPGVLGAPTANGTGIPVAPPVTGTTLPQPAPSQLAPSANTLSAAVDSQGIPWDARIHSSSKATKGDGTWKLKRGLEDGVAQRVTAELIAAKVHVPTVPAVTVATRSPIASTPNPVPLPSPMPVPTTPVLGLPNTDNAGVVPPLTPTVSLPQGSALVSGVPVPQPAPALQPGILPGHLPSAGSVQDAVPVAPVNPVVRFSQMMAKITAALAAKTITQQQVLDAHRLPHIGLDQLQQLVLNPDKIPLMEAALGLA